jgi:hypothetical protein
MDQPEIREQSTAERRLTQRNGAESVPMDERKIRKQSAANERHAMSHENANHAAQELDSPSDADSRQTRRDVCLACDQCIKRPAMPLACALIVNRNFQPCAAKLARMQAHSQARCPHPDPAQRTKWDAAELSILGRPVHAKRAEPPVGSDGSTGRAARQPNHRGTQFTGATPIYTRRVRMASGPPGPFAAIQGV